MAFIIIKLAEPETFAPKVYIPGVSENCNQVCERLHELGSLWQRLWGECDTAMAQLQHLSKPPVNPYISSRLVD